MHTSTRRAVLAFSMSPFITYVLVMLGDLMCWISRLWMLCRGRGRAPGGGRGMKVEDVQRWLYPRRACHTRSQISL